MTNVDIVIRNTKSGKFKLDKNQKVENPFLLEISNGYFSRIVVEKGLWNHIFDKKYRQDIKLFWSVHKGQRIKEKLFAHKLRDLRTLWKKIEFQNNTRRIYRESFIWFVHNFTLRCTKRFQSFNYSCLFLIEGRMVTHINSEMIISKKGNFRNDKRTVN